jgi:hypothetical protein
LRRAFGRARAGEVVSRRRAHTTLRCASCLEIHESRRQDPGQSWRSAHPAATQG